MKITFISHASILVETRGLRILSDPWWNGPCFGAQWWTYPPAHLEPLSEVAPDYIYLSHGHHDHLHPGTLSGFPRSAKLIVARDLDLAPGLRDLGFEVIEVDGDRPLALGESQVTVRVMPTHGDDTLMVIADGDEVCINVNDALHSAPESVRKEFIARLRSLHATIDYVFCGYGIASHFPNCYRIPGKDAAATTAARQRYFNRQWASIVAGLQPRFAFPFAADVVFLEEDLFWANEPTHNTERPTRALKELEAPETEAIDIAPGFVIENGVVLNDIRRQPIREQALRAQLGPQIQRANRYGSVDASQVNEVLLLLRQRAVRCEGYLESFPHDYRVAIIFRNGDKAIVWTKRGGTIELGVASRDEAHRNANLIVTTRFAYLKWALTRPHGDEILFVGSGVLFDYPSRDAAKLDLHLEFMRLVRGQAFPAHRSVSKMQAWNYRLKQAVKRLLRRQQDQDLYDLLAWTRFSAPDP